VIRWITENLGTAPAADPALGDGAAVLDVRDLVDKFGNSPAATREKIEQGVRLLREGRRVIVCCDYGISRSNSIAAGILASFGGLSLEQAIRRVVEKTGEREIKLDPLRSVREALSGEASSCAGSEPRLLLTGGTGFLGRLVAARLGGGRFLVAPSRQELELTSGALSLDLLVKEHRINCILHLANPRVYTSNNAIGETVTMLRNVLDVCRENGTRLIYPSGWEVYTAYRTSHTLADEALPLFPKGPYGEAKLCCEQLIAHHRNLYGLHCGLLRSGPLYGETGDRPKFIFNFLDKARKNLPITTHRYLNGEPRLDLLHAGDFVSALAAAVESGFEGSLNLGYGEAVSTREIARWLVERVGSRSTLGEREIGDYTANITMDISKARRVLGWQPTVHWQTGLARLVDEDCAKQRVTEPE